MAHGLPPIAPSPESETAEERLYRSLSKRFRDLEVSHVRLREQFEYVVREKEAAAERSRGGDGMGDDIAHVIHGLSSKRFYSNVLQSIGHALHICRPDSGEIIFWNQSAENLFGWKEYEILGKRADELLFDEERFTLFKNIDKELKRGQSWSGQLPFRKRSGEMFIAMVTKSLLYEDNEFIGVITVSKDAVVFNNNNIENFRTYRGMHDHGPLREWKKAVKKIQWHTQPQIASSVSNLASKIFSPRRGETQITIASTGSKREMMQNADIEELQRTELMDIGVKDGKADPDTKQSFQVLKGKCSDGNEHGILSHNGDLLSMKTTASFYACVECSKMAISGNALPQSGFVHYGKDSQVTAKVPDEDLLEETNGRQNQDLGLRLPSSRESDDSGQSSSSDRGSEVENPLAEYEIQWEDLLLGEEVGQGSFGVVYRGIWNGSDVAIKVYLGNEFREGILLDYKKEIAIMKKLRHPNVLLFMGAVYSPDRLAIVTEFLPRGSLFKTLHRNSQALDIRRRLRMALDVARGMNYLHRRNPPIVHRDLKSSNLLVDKNWTVKVGDFGLSRFKMSDFLTAKSGRGTPQWMAPEILRNEPSNEKSDVYSFGVIMWELMTQYVPWAHLNPLQVVGVVGYMDQRLDLPQNLDPRISSIINDCWQSDPERRPSFGDLLRRMTEDFKISSLATSFLRKPDSGKD